MILRYLQILDPDSISTISMSIYYTINRYLFDPYVYILILYLTTCRLLQIIAREPADLGLGRSHLGAGLVLSREKWWSFHQNWERMMDIEIE